jgi:hypothetical protein
MPNVSPAMKKLGIRISTSIYWRVNMQLEDKLINNSNKSKEVKNEEI